MTRKPTQDARQVRVLASISDVAATAWDRCANPILDQYNPFVSHGFLLALEQSGCVGAQTGWHVQHLVLENNSGDVLGCMPCYVKTHSYGEYVFDHAWANAFEQAGGQYYPKMQSSVPFTPVTGPRLLIPDVADAAERERQLLDAALQLCARYEVSSFHLTFVNPAQAERIGQQGFLLRTDQQFHWCNDRYARFEDFLAALASRKRKNIRKERQQVHDCGICFEWRRGAEISEAHWDRFFEFYQDTGARKWGSPYLNRRFFSLVGEAMADRVLLILCRQGDRYIAGALNFIGGDTLYGRYWGCVEQLPCLHFETCYYQAIEFAIAHRLQFVEAGAQGEHKLARGYLPQTTYSAHHIVHPGFRDAIARFLAKERSQVALESEFLRAHAPFSQRDDSR